MDDFYIQPTVTDFQTVEIIKHHINKQLPFCLSRFGDGEIYFINNNAPDFLKKKFCNLWGHNIADFQKERDKIHENIKYALINSDIIGVLDKNNDVCKTIKYNEEKWSIKHSYLRNLYNKQYVICDHQITRGTLLGNAYNFKNIINGNNVAIISPNDTLDTKLLSCIFEADVELILIDNNREEIIKKLSKIKSQIVLYGISLTGKDLGAILKKKYDKIAIDFGSTLDAWAGLETKPWFKDGGIQEHCMIKR